MRSEPHDVPQKDASNELPVPKVWRSTIEDVIQRFANGDFELAEGVPCVDSPSASTTSQIRAYLEDYGASLIPLHPTSWESSVALWMETHWEVLVDLWTVEEGGSDLVLHLNVYEEGPRFRYEIYLVYVP